MKIKIKIEKKNAIMNISLIVGTRRHSKRSHTVDYISTDEWSWLLSGRLKLLRGCYG